VLKQVEVRDGSNDLRRLEADATGVDATYLYDRSGVGSTRR